MFGSLARRSLQRSLRTLQNILKITFQVSKRNIFASVSQFVLILFKKAVFRGYQTAPYHPKHPHEGHINKYVTFCVRGTIKVLRL